MCDRPQAGIPAADPQALPASTCGPSHPIRHAAYPSRLAESPIAVQACIYGQFNAGKENGRIPFQHEDGLLVHRCATGWAILAGDACHLLQSAAHIHAAPEIGAWQTQNCLPDFGAVACDRIYIARIPLPHRHCRIYDEHGSYQSASNANSRMISLPHVSRTSNVSAVQFVRLMLASHSR